MGLETFTYITSFVATNPTASDLQMCPPLTAHDPVTLLAANAVEQSKLSKGYSASRISRSHGDYVIIGQLHHPMILAGFMRKALARMKDVVAMRGPLQIINAIVRRVEVNVIHLVLFARRGANKGDGDQPMHEGSNPRSTLVKLNSAVAVLAFAGHKNFTVRPSASRAETADVTKIGNRIKRFVAGDWLPNFIHFQPLIVDSSVVSAWQPTQKSTFGSYPSQAGAF